MTQTKRIPGVNFCEQLIRPSDYFGAGNALLLCLNAEELLLHHFFLTQGESSSPIVLQVCVKIARGIRSSSLVHVQKPQTKNDLIIRVLRKAAHLHGLDFIEANPPEFTP